MYSNTVRRMCWAIKCKRSTSLWGMYGAIKCQRSTALWRLCGAIKCQRSTALWRMYVAMKCQRSTALRSKCGGQIHKQRHDREQRTVRMNGAAKRCGSLHKYCQECVRQWRGRDPNTIKNESKSKGTLQYRQKNTINNEWKSKRTGQYPQILSRMCEAMTWQGSQYASLHALSWMIRRNRS